MKVFMIYLRLFTSYCLFAFSLFAVTQHSTIIYLLYQAKGQLSVLLCSETFEEYAEKKILTVAQRENLDLIKRIKNYSVDSLGYLSTGNFNRIYDQSKSPVLWVITASKPYALEPYYWNFPLVGKVSYKGFFRKDMAERQYYNLRSMGYDVCMRSASAWSTLGWFNDPVMSGMLQRTKTSFCDLLFHELFHATCYVRGEVDYNENMASFVAEKATKKFLANDTLSMNNHLRNEQQNNLVNRFMNRKREELSEFYITYKGEKDIAIRKLKFFLCIADSVRKLPLPAATSEYHTRSLLDQKNAYFIDLAQYNGMQEKIEKTFNKIYGGDLKKLVQDLKQNQTIIKFDN